MEDIDKRKEAKDLPVILSARYNSPSPKKTRISWSEDAFNTTNEKAAMLISTFQWWLYFLVRKLWSEIINHPHL